MSELFRPGRRTQIDAGITCSIPTPRVRGDRPKYLFTDVLCAFGARADTDLEDRQQQQDVLIGSGAARARMAEWMHVDNRPSRAKNGAFDLSGR